MTDPYLPLEAEVVTRTMETPGVATLALRLTDPEQRQAFRFRCGQFNMLYLFGLGEVPISIMDQHQDCLLHTIRGVGRISNHLIRLEPGQRLGLRGPFGNSWPLAAARGRDVVFVTAGLGCAPVIAAIRQVIADRQQFGRLVIMQGVKHREDLLWQAQYDAWRQVPDCQVLLAASEEKQAHPQWSLGMVTVLIDKAEFDPHNCVVMMCGPDPMLRASIRALTAGGVPPEDIHMSLELNMQCAVGMCGHCQLGPPFVCREGPIFSVPRIADWFMLRGY